MFVALTISPKYIDNEQNAVYVAYVNRYISRIRVNYLLYPEFDLKGRLHFHGLLERTKENLKEYNWTIKFLSNWCFICVKEIKTMGNWLRYIKKEWKMTKKILKLKLPLSNKINKDITMLDYPDFIIE